MAVRQSAHCVSRAQQVVVGGRAYAGAPARRKTKR